MSMPYTTPQCVTGKPCGRTCIAHEKECRRGFDSPSYQKAARRLRATTERLLGKGSRRDYATGSARLPNVKRSHLTDTQQRIIDAVILWTNGFVPAVRDPGLFDPDEVEEIEGIVFGATRKHPEQREVYNVTPTEESYKDARKVMTALSMAPAGKDVPDIHRGVRLKQSVIDSLEPGTEFDTGTINSFSAAERESNRFALATESEEDRAKIPVVFHIDWADVKRGTNIKGISTHYREEEFVTGGRARVLSKAYERINHDGGVFHVWNVHLEQV